MTNMRPPSKTVLLKVVILGNGGVGKSCLMNRFVSNRYEENNFHTIGVEFLNKDIEFDGVKYTLQIWDTAGQERFRTLRTPFYRGSDICLLCFAVNERESLRSLKQWHSEFIRYADIKAEKFPFIVVGNKNDMSPSQRQVTKEEVQQWCNDNSISSFIETSSKTAYNVKDAFELAVRQWKQLECETENELRQQRANINLNDSKRLAPNRWCCAGGGVIEGNNDSEDESMSAAATNRFGRRILKPAETNDRL